MASAENVDFRAPDCLLWRVARGTCSRACSIAKIAQNRIVEPIHPLHSQDNACLLSAETILSIEYSKLRAPGKNQEKKLILFRQNSSIAAQADF